MYIYNSLLIELLPQDISEERIEYDELCSTASFIDKL